MNQKQNHKQRQNSSKASHMADQTSAVTSDRQTEIKETKPFDRVFRTMAEKLPELFIYLINEVFRTEYDVKDKERIEHWRNEHQTKNGEIITDVCLKINDVVYHIECQSNPDGTMAFRMIEYGFAIALDNIIRKNNVYETVMPRSCVLYLRHNANTPERLTTRIYSADRKEYIDYESKIIKVQNYTRNEIFQKKLLVLLPYYIMRYERDFESINEDADRISALLDEYRIILYKLEEEGYENEYMTNSLIELIVQISDYMLEKYENIRRGMMEMLSPIYELKADKLLYAEQKISELQQKNTEIQRKNTEIQRKNTEIQQKNIDLEKVISALLKMKNGDLNTEELDDIHLLCRKYDIKID